MEPRKMITVITIIVLINGLVMRSLGSCKRQVKKSVVFWKCY